MANRVTIDVRVIGLKSFAESMGAMGRSAFDRSQRKAVTFLAKDFRKFKTGKINRDIDRPAPFTKRAYDFDGAGRSGDIVSRAFVRTRQSEYMDLVETGGIRRRRGKNRPFAVKPQFQDRFGGAGGAKAIERRFINKSARPSSRTASGQPRYKTGDRVYRVLKLRTATGVISGVFEKRKMGGRTTRSRIRAGNGAWRTRLVIRLMNQARYKPQLNFGKDARTYARTRFPSLSLRLFNQELARLQSRGRR